MNREYGQKELTSFIVDASKSMNNYENTIPEMKERVIDLGVKAIFNILKNEDIVRLIDEEDCNRIYDIADVFYNLVEVTVNPADELGIEDTVDKMEGLQLIEDYIANIGYESVDNYTFLIDLADDLEDLAPGEHLRDGIDEIYNFIEDDWLMESDMLVKEAEYGIDRLRCFLGDTHSDAIYRINGYGNLENVDKETFIEAAEELKVMFSKYFE